jgi:putative SOS response-associated peptidase YedK
MVAMFNARSEEFTTKPALPVILGESDWPKWLGEEPATEQELLALLRPCPDDWLKIWPVDNKVGNVRNTGRELMLPLEEPLL